MQALAFLAVFVYATHATQAIAFEWKPGFSSVISVHTTLTVSAITADGVMASTQATGKTQVMKF